MGFLLVFGTIFAVAGIGNLVSGYIETGMILVGLWLGAYAWAYFLYRGRQRRRADAGSRTLAALSRVSAIIGDVKDRHEAIRRLETELARNEQDAEIMHSLSQQYFEIGDHRRAYELAETVIRLNPSEGRYHFVMSTLFFGACVEGKTETGITLKALGMDYNKAKDKAEFHARAAIRLGVYLEMEAQARETLTNLRLLDQT